MINLQFSDAMATARAKGRVHGQGVPLETRFWAKVERRGRDECWPWRGARNPSGYGLFRGGTEQLAHRVAWVLSNDTAVPVGKSILHSCNNRGCCNPAHLRAGTQAENMADASAAGTVARPGERNGRSVITAEQVREIRRLYDAGAGSPRVIAKHLGVSVHSVRKVAYRRGWASVPEEPGT